VATCRSQGDTEEFFTSYDEVHESFDDMGLQENLLRGIYAYGIYLIPDPYTLFNNSLKFGHLTSINTSVCRF
jgi:hypothetical protein